MSIRDGQLYDIPTLVALDRAAYGSYGADEGYFRQKFQSPEARIIVSETDGQVTGFVVF